MIRLLTIGMVLFAGFTVDTTQSAAARSQRVARGGQDPPPRHRLDFDTDVVPVLTKAGCNAAACHGAAAGRGGFYLSLFGGDPGFDFAQIARELNGRRINRSAPEMSLLLRKPTGELDHEGGIRFEVDSREYRLLLSWIASGARRESARQATMLDVVFSKHSKPIALSQAELPIVLRPEVTAHFSDGEARDVTEWTRWEVDDESMLAIGSDGSLTIQRSGRGHLFVSFLDQIEVIPISVARESASKLERTYRELNRIDSHVNSTLRQLGIPAQPQADEATLLRRVTLALTGQLPAEQTVLDYLDDSHSDKYERYVDRLIDSPEFDRYWAYRWSRYLRVNAPPNEPEVAVAIRQWLQRGLSDERPWDAMMEEMITASGDSHHSGAAAIHRLTSDPRSEAEYMSEVVLGIRLRCANCHDHPLDRWKQNDYHGLAAVFASVSRGRQIEERSKGEVIHPATGEAAVRQLPGGRRLDTDESGRLAFAAWVRSEPRHYLARVTVNRLWQSMMGRGLVEPVDDLRDSNPATHPRLLDDLTGALVANGYQLAPIVREIALSDTFRRQTVSNDPQATRYHAAFEATALDPFLLLDAISQVTGIAEHESAIANHSRAIDQANPYFASPALDALGRCAPGEACLEDSNSSGLSLPTALHLINGELLNTKITNKQGTLSQLIDQGASDAAVIRHFYLVALARLPRERERSFWLAAFKRRESDSETTPQEDRTVTRRRHLEDFAWALLNSQEFRTNH